MNRRSIRRTVASMPRRLRVSTGGLAYHALNRAVGRSRIFTKEADYLAFERVLEQVHQRLPVRILAYCLMPNHWHIVLWPDEDGQLSEFLRLLTVTHTQRWHAHHHTAGTGPLYQGRFKSFPIQKDDHLLTAGRYAERNPVRAKLVPRARDWRFGSAWWRTQKQLPAWLLPLKRWPVDVPRDWPAWVDRPETTAELESLRQSVKRGRPFGSERWQKRTAAKLELESTLRPRGRPRVHPVKEKRLPTP